MQFVYMVCIVYIIKVDYLKPCDNKLRYSLPFWCLFLLSCIRNFAQKIRISDTNYP